jgi:amino acid adenylation domain-containing protein
MVGAFNANLAGSLWSTAHARGAATAVVERGRETSYAALLARAAAIAAALVGAGLDPDDRVAVLVDGASDAIAAFFGILAAGGIAVVLNEMLRHRQITQALRDCGATLLLTSANLTAAGSLPPAVGLRTLLLDDIPAAGSFEPVARLGTDAAQIIYTSGSTGQPKGVTVTHANLAAATRAVTSYLDITSRDRIAGILSFSFVYGMSQVLCATATGAALVAGHSPFPADLVGELRASRVSVLAAVPPLWLQLLDVPAFRAAPLPDLRIMTNAGGRLPVAAVRALREAQPHAQLFLMYGLTEALRCTYLPTQEVDRHPDSIGRPIPGGSVLVLRDGVTPCVPGEVGELVYRGPTVTLGYWNNPEATARVFRPHPLRPAAAPDSERVVFTGDLVRQDLEGLLYFVGRRDRMIKTLGYRVSPDEVAEVIHASGEVADCVVVAEQDDLRGQRIVAHVVLATNGSLDRLKRHCGTELPRYMQPARFEVRATLPRLPSGKHDLRAVTVARAARGAQADAR